MFCPNCGQQQPAESTKYCPRCGTPIAGLAQWLAAAGATTAVVREAAPPPAGPAPLTPRRKGMRRGGKLMFLSVVLLPFLIALGAAVGEGAPIILSFVLFFIGLSMMLYARIFSDNTPPAAAGSHAPPQVHGATPSALPPAADTRFRDFARRGVRTSELSQPPPSVTENTTRLLDDE